MGGGGTPRMTMAMSDEDDNGERSCGSKSMLIMRRRDPRIA